MHPDHREVLVPAVRLVRPDLQVSLDRLVRVESLVLLVGTEPRERAVCVESRVRRAREASPADLDPRDLLELAANQDRTELQDRGKRTE